MSSSARNLSLLYTCVGCVMIRKSFTIHLSFIDLSWLLASSKSPPNISPKTTEMATIFAAQKSFFLVDKQSNLYLGKLSIRRWCHLTGFHFTLHINVITSWRLQNDKRRLLVFTQKIFSSNQSWHWNSLSLDVVVAL